MPRRKNRAYLKKAKKGVPASSRDSNRDMVLRSARIGFEQHQFPGIFNASVFAPGPDLIQQKGRSNHDRRIIAEEYRRRVFFVTTLSVILTSLSGITGFLSLQFATSTFSLSDFYTHAALILASVLQLPLVVLYWSYWLQYEETARVALRLSKQPIVALSDSWVALWQCGLECAFNLLFLPPANKECVTVDFTSKSNFVCLSELVYFLILARSYHLIRFFFWTSKFSDLRTKLYTRLTVVRPGRGYLLRCCLARYTYQLIISLYAVMVVVPGVVQYIVESNSESHAREMIADNLWLVSYTQATIGYGDDPPLTMLGQLTIILSCLVGVFTIGLLNSVSSSMLTLSLSESDLCSELILGKIRRKQMTQATILIQSWWRLMVMRKMKCIHAPVILRFYSRLGKFRKLLVPRQRVKYGRFEYQIQSFEAAVHKKIKTTNEYLAPAIDMAETLVCSTQTHDMVRLEYQILRLVEKTKKQKVVGKHLRIRKADQNTEMSTSPSTSTSNLQCLPGSNRTKRLAKRKNEAFQHLKARLLLRDT